jgi:3-oxoacyl-[acyl-carrier protein] reductase
MQKSYLIAGGTSGIGLALVRRLRKLEPESRILTVSRREAHPDQESDENLNHISRDLSAGAWDDALRETLPESLDAVAYCPGSINLKPFHRLSAEDFLNDFQLNLMGAVHTLQACLPALQKSEAGQALLFSTVAVQTGFPFHASVSSAKGAVEGLARALAAELAPDVAVNAIAPALTDTPLAERLLKSDNQRKAATERSPLKSILSPADIADFAAALLTASRPAVTGQVYPIDGGMSAVRL